MKNKIIIFHFILFFSFVHAILLFFFLLSTLSPDLRISYACNLGDIKDQENYDVHDFFKSAKSTSVPNRTLNVEKQRSVSGQVTI